MSCNFVKVNSYLYSIVLHGNNLYTFECKKIELYEPQLYFIYSVTFDPPVRCRSDKYHLVMED